MGLEKHRILCMFIIILKTDSRFIWAEFRNKYKFQDITFIYLNVIWCLEK